MKKLLPLFLLLAVLLCGCQSLPVPGVLTEPVKTEPPVEKVAQVVTAEELLEFDRLYPQLKRADFRGSECYAEIADYIAQHPQVEVLYDVNLGTVTVAPDTDSLTFTGSDYHYLALRDNLQFLPRLKTLFFRNTNLAADTIEELRSLYPNVNVEYTVTFCGMEVDAETEELDISALEPSQVLEQLEAMKRLHNLRELYLMTQEDKSPYTMEDAAAIQAALPDAFLHYSFFLYGQLVSTEDEEIVYASKNFGYEAGSLERVRQALTLLKGCKRFVLDNCKFTNEEMAQLREEFRGRTNVVWRVWFGNGGVLTDREVLRHVYELYDYNSANLIYCEGAEFIDFGHNELLRQCDFVAGMPNLKAIILSGSMVQDMTPFQNCPNLEFLELAFCGYVTDISPLAACTNLKRLNIAFTKVDDLSALDGIDMEVLVDARSRTDAEDWDHFAALHPNCITQHTGDAKEDQPYGYPWRYEKDGNPNPYYALLKEKFHYPNPFNTLW